MGYRIISRRSSIMGRAVTYEINGKIREITAPALTASFDDLEKQIAREAESETAPDTSPPFDVDETPPKKTETTEKTTTTKRSRKSSAR